MNIIKNKQNKQQEWVKYQKLNKQNNLLLDHHHNIQNHIIIIY